MADQDPPYQLAYLSAAWRDYQQLDGSQKVFVDKGLDRIRLLGMRAGQPLAGELSSCRKLKNKHLGLRIVFRQVDQQIQVIQIVAIGRRADKKVYHTAEKRLSKFKE
ncbi:addiction module toxin RelE [Levilactobacillus suantsaiihabitans]|uniref:Addiction module toxin RelE n=1 Tax=Levilactobacillus suantsaiihabitans TaxID=2487722 RepID=A0A4Z0JEX4_9LACO|nr:addiction module toxin RelE [Levilactobacillus suantsaiihabitans]TGD20062.1 addiction module toxin RelE [Levilactobacillus suantsaiihabitans]